MFLKAIILCLAFCVLGLNARCYSKNFFCNSKNPREVTTYSGYKLHCTDGQICNKHYINPCTPCIFDEYKCVGNHQCNKDDLSSVYIDKIKYLCGEHKECNIRDENQCEPCIEKKCPDPRFFRCGKDEDSAIIFNFVVPCVKGTVCNRNYKHPCKPCIKEEDDDHDNDEVDDDDDDDDDDESDYHNYYNYYDDIV